jgi:hypothetical protein
MQRVASSTNPLAHPEISSEPFPGVTPHFLRQPSTITVVDSAGAREWVGDLLARMSRAVRPSKSPGPAMGSWRDQWHRVELGLARIEAVYAGRPEPEGTAGASYDVYTFFVTCHHLADWLASDASLPRSTQRKGRALVSKSNELKMCADLANRSKHCALTRTRTGDSSTGPSGNDATVMMGRGAKHAFRISSSGTERDALDLAQACVRSWRTFLVAQGLS